MLTKQDHINYWTKTGQDSWDAGVYLLEGRKNVEALFMFCLAVEKWLKANWILDNIDNNAPRIHDLQSIYSQTDFELTPDLIDFLDTINRWNLEGRYPDYRFTLQKLATKEYTLQQFEKLQKIKICLLERL
ncbi:MAG: HEPN domain-containing protein [Saprospiraceae bacterium]